MHGRFCFRATPRIHIPEFNFYTGASMSKSMRDLRSQVSECNSPARLRYPAFCIVNALQDTAQNGYNGAEQVLGTAVALMALCESSGLRLQDVLTRAGRMMNNAEAPFTAEVRSIRDYAKNEMSERSFG